MKKILPVLILCCLLTGCGEKVNNEYGQQVSKIGPYIEISREEGITPSGVKLYFIKAYDEKTHIIHRIVYGMYTYDDSYLYSYDEEGHPVLQFYEEGKDNH